MIEELRPEAFIWQGNPRKWHGSGTMDSYVSDKSQFVYWATPHYRDQIRVGDKAYIWRALGEGPRGIVAIGKVAELPREYSQATVLHFKHPGRVAIGEAAASSSWKTGISISEVRTRIETGMLTAEMLTAICPTLSILRMPRRTVYPLDAEQSKKIDRLWASTVRDGAIAK